MKMGKSSDSVRFLDDVDMSFTLDSRSSSAQQLTSIEISSKPVIFRASYRDINLITTIVNKAIELSNKAQGNPDSAKANSDPTLDASLQPAKSHHGKSQASAMARSRSVGKAKVIVSREQVSRRYIPDATDLVS